MTRDGNGSAETLFLKFSPYGWFVLERLEISSLTPIPSILGTSLESRRYVDPKRVRGYVKPHAACRDDEFVSSVIHVD